MTPAVLSRSDWHAEVDDAVAALAVSREGRVAVAGAEGSLTLLSADGVVEHRQVLSFGCLSVAWSPAGDRIAVGCVDGVRVLDASGTPLFDHLGGWCASVAWSFDGARLAAALGRTAVVFDAAGKQLTSCGRDSTVTAVAWINRRIACAAYGGVHVYPVSPGAAGDVLPFTGSLLALTISPDRRWAASGNQDATLHVWRIGRQGDELEMSSYPRKLTTLAFSPDSTLLASGGGADVTVWDFGGRGPRGSTPRILRGGDDAVTTVVWSPDGERLAGAGGDGRVAVWAPRHAVPGSPMPESDVLTRPCPATAVCWDPAGRLIAGWADATVVARSPER